MARDIKDEIHNEGQDVPTQDAGPLKHPMQIQIDEQMEKTIVGIVQADYDSAKTARDKKDYGITSKGQTIRFGMWIKEIRDLYNAKRIPKTVPWKFCSNRSLRIAASILDMLHAKHYSSIVNEDLVRWRPGETKDFPKVERITKLMHWWIWVRSRMRTFYDNWVKTVMGYGDAITESSWKVQLLQTGTSINEPVTGEDGNQLINPDGTPSAVKGFEPDRLESTASKVYLRDQFLLQDGSENIDEEPVIIEEEILYRDLEKGELEGKFVNVTNMLRSKIPVEVKTSANLSEDEAERVRDARIRNHPVKVVREYIHLDLNKDGFAEDILVKVSLEHDLYLGGVEVKNLTFSGKRPLDYTKYESRIEAPQENWE